ncbi:amidohydrolase family protein [Bosea psychrotolerans]|uniref:Beta-aspartyl-dipeptidase (Metallo-type) n=1 Tax=Bosea psychrotolerans TaxID=1871628 RepID=A0A2S4LXL4_9HYPH|nr:amidohydrolase family protein [Bosea psychrotolerans]POR47186.1 beta-aspartyl-dipeptidase (metallo-type) [Bosea psychrotolerans]
MSRGDRHGLGIVMSAGAAPLRLLRAPEVFAPAAIGSQEILIGGGRILAIGPDLAATATLPGLVEVVRLPAGKLVPGLIDQHVHFIGGGEGDGPHARMPELSFEAFASAGVTTAVGLLGSEIEAKTLPLLLRKAHELDRAGLTSFIYSGAMALPAPCLTQSVRSDIVLVDKVIGAKSAIAERAFPNLDFPGFAALAGELAQAKAMSGKAAVLHLHVGRLQSGLTTLFDLVESMDFPPAQAVPTHVNRSPDGSPVFEQGIRFANAGGIIDFTCCLGPRDGIPAGLDAVEAVQRALDAGVPEDRITLSSDAGVAVPAAGGQGGFVAVPPSILFRDLKRLATEGGLGWAQALPFVTSNVARVLGLAGRKGGIAPGMDADLVFIGEDDRIAWVMSSGRLVFSRADDANQ